MGRKENLQRPRSPRTVRPRAPTPRKAPPRCHVYLAHTCPLRTHVEFSERLLMQTGPAIPTPAKLPSALPVGAFGGSQVLAIPVKPLPFGNDHPVGGTVWAASGGSFTPLLTLVAPLRAEGHVKGPPTPANPGAALAGCGGTQGETQGETGTAPGCARGGGGGGGTRGSPGLARPSGAKARGGAGRHRQLPPQTPPTARPASPILPLPASPHPPNPWGGLRPGTGSPDPPHQPGGSPDPLINTSSVLSACPQPTQGDPRHAPGPGAVKHPRVCTLLDPAPGTWDPGIPRRCVAQCSGGLQGVLGVDRVWTRGQGRPSWHWTEPSRGRGGGQLGGRRGSHSGVRVGYTLGGPHGALGTAVTQADPASGNTPTGGGGVEGDRLKGVLSRGSEKHLKSSTLVGACTADQEPEVGAMRQTRSRGVEGTCILRVTQ